MKNLKKTLALLALISTATVFTAQGMHNQRALHTSSNNEEFPPGFFENLWHSKPLAGIQPQDAPKKSLPFQLPASPTKPKKKSEGNKHNPIVMDEGSDGDDKKPATKNDKPKKSRLKNTPDKPDAPRASGRKRKPKEIYEGEVIRRQGRNTKQKATKKQRKQVEADSAQGGSVSQGPKKRQKPAQKKPVKKEMPLNGKKPQQQSDDDEDKELKDNDAISEYDVEGRKAAIFKNRPIAQTTLDEKELISSYADLEEEFGQDTSNNRLQFFQSFLTELFGTTLTGTPDQEKLTHIKTLYELLDKGHIPTFFNELNKLGFDPQAHNDTDATRAQRRKQTKEYARELKLSNQNNKFKVDQTIMFYHDLMSLMFDKEALFNAANILFDYTFGKRTFARFKNRFITKTQESNDQGPSREYYASTSIIIGSLIFYGWLNWSEATLQALHAHAQEGKRVVYIAGGFDIKQLVKYGIYNIDIIDPIHPVQAMYLNVKNPEWILQNNQNDIVDETSLTFHDEQFEDVILRKTAYEEDGTIEVNNKNGERTKKISKPKSITTWTVFNKKTNKPLGTIVFHRRYCEQSDFAMSADKVLLMSFNEFCYVSGGKWGINAADFSAKICIFIKQLHKPMKHAIIANLAQAEKIKSLQSLEFGRDAM